MGQTYNLGKVKGANATINGNNTLTIQGGTNITATQVGTTLTIDASSIPTTSGVLTNDTKLPTGAAVTTALSGKQDNITGTNGQIVTIGSGGTPVATGTHTVTVSFTGPNGDSNFTAPTSMVETVMVGKTYNIVSPTIPGYVPSQNLVTGTMGNSDVTVSIAYVHNMATLSITYVGPNDNNFVTPTAVNEEVRIGEDYSVTSPAVSTYTPNLATVSGNMGINGRSVTVTYTRNKRTLTVNFTGPDDGTFVTPSSIVKQVTIGDTYNETVPTVGDYISDINLVTGIMPDEDVTVLVTYSPPYEIYAFSIDQTESNPASMVTYPGSSRNANYTPAHMDFTNDVFDYGSWANAFFIKNLKVVVLKDSGEVNFELNPNDYTKKLDGTASGIASTSLDGNVMIAIPTVWVKLVQGVDDDHFTYYIANYQADNDYKAYMHTDSKVESLGGVWATANIIDYTYISAYEVSNSNRSLSGQTIRTNINTDRSSDNIGRINYLGYRSLEWNIETLADHNLISLLLLLISKTTDSQTAFGNGYNAYNNAAAASGDKLQTGTMNQKGLFWGKNDGTAGVKVFGIENYWGNWIKTINGLAIVDQSKGFGMYYKYTYGIEDGSSGYGYISDATEKNNVQTRFKLLGQVRETSSPFNNLIAKDVYLYKMKATEFGMIPWPTPVAGVTNSESMYYCDYFSFDTPSSGELYITRRSSSYGNSSRTEGLFCMTFATYTYSASAFMVMRPKQSIGYNNIQ